MERLTWRRSRSAWVSAAWLSLHSEMPSSTPQSSSVPSGWQFAHCQNTVSHSHAHSFLLTPHRVTNYYFTKQKIIIYLYFQWPNNDMQKQKKELSINVRHSISDRQIVYFNPLSWRALTWPLASVPSQLDRFWLQLWYHVIYSRRKKIAWFAKKRSSLNNLTQSEMWRNNTKRTTLRQADWPPLIAPLTHRTRIKSTKK